MSQEKKSKKEDIEKLRKILDSPDDPKIRKSISKDEKNLESIVNRLSGEPKKTKYTSTDFLYKGPRSLEPRVTVHKKEEEISPPEIQKKEPELPKEEVTEEFPTTEEDLFDDVELYEIEKVEISEPEFMEVKAKEEPKTDEVIFEETEPSLPMPKEEETSIDEPLPKWEPVEEPKTEEKVEIKEGKTIEKVHEFEEIEEKPEIPPKETEEELPKWEPVEVIEEEVEKPSEPYEEKLTEEEIEEISKEEKKKAKRAEKEKKIEQKRKEKEEQKKEIEEKKLQLLEEKRAKKNAKIQEREAKKKEKERAREEKLKEKEQAKAEKKEKKFKKLEPEHKEIAEKDDQSLKFEEEIIEEDAKLVDAKLKESKLEGKLDVFNEIKSIDEKTAWLLYTSGFTSIEKLKESTVNDIVKVKGIRRGVAKKIKKEVGTSEIEKEKITLPKRKEKRRTKKLKTEQEELSEWESYTVEEESPGLQPELSPFTYEIYTLYKKEIETASGKKRTIHFFSKKKPEVGEAVQLPDGYEVKINKRTRLPYLKKKK